MATSEHSSEQGEDSEQSSTSIISTLEELTSGNKEIIAVLHTEESLPDANLHVEYHKGNSNQAVACLCNDIGYFQRLDIAQYSRFDIIVGTGMYNILMDGYRLHHEANAKLKKIAEQRKKIYVIDVFAGDFDELYHQLPRSVRGIIQLRADSPQEFKVIHSTGASGGLAKGSVNVGSADGQKNLIINISDPFGFYQAKMEEMKAEIARIEKNKAGVSPDGDPLTFDIRIKTPTEKEDQYLSKLNENIDNFVSSNEGLINAEVTMGSIIITITVENSHIVTEEWIRNILSFLFNNILGPCMDEGEIIDVDIDRSVQYVFPLPQDPRLHDNCVSLCQHQAEVNTLNERIAELMLERQSQSDTVQKITHPVMAEVDEPEKKSESQQKGEKSPQTEKSFRMAPEEKCYSDIGEYSELLSDSGNSKKNYLQGLMEQQDDMLMVKRDRYGYIDLLERQENITGLGCISSRLYLAEKLGERSVVRHFHHEALRNCYPLLTSELDLIHSKLMDDLLASDVLSVSGLESIKGCDTRKRQNEEFYGYLVGHLTFEEFHKVLLPALRKDHQHVADALIRAL